MSDRYGLPKEDGYIESYYTIGQRKNILNLPDIGNVCNPTPEQLEAAGYVLMVPAEYDTATQKLGRNKKHGSVGHPEIIDMTMADKEELASNKLFELEKEITTLANEKVSCHIDPIEKPHWMGVADALTRQHNLWLEERLTANIEERAADEITYPPLTADDKQLWTNLSIIQGLTAAIRDAATGMLDAIYQMSTSEIIALPDDWVSTNILWP